MNLEVIRVAATGHHNPVALALALVLVTPLAVAAVFAPFLLHLDQVARRWRESSKKDRAHLPARG